MRTPTRADLMAVPVTTGLIAVNVLVYIAELVHPRIIDRFGMLGDGLMKDGQVGWYCKVAYCPQLQPVGIAHGDWYRLITGAFIHQSPTNGSFGILHILFNMIWIWVLGRVLEPHLGSIRFATLYLLSVLGGAVMVYWLAPHTNTIGASGAVFGLAATYFVYSRRHALNTQHAQTTVVYLLVSMVLLAGVSSWQGHLGGLIAGGISAAAFAYAPARNRVLWQVAATAIILAACAFAIAAKTHTLTG